MDKTIFRNKWVVGIIIIILIGLCFAIYMVMQVNKNLTKMSSGYGTTTYFPPYPPINTQGKTPAQIATIKRGEYLITMGDCIACHTDTDHKGPSLAGGLAMQTPYGVIYTPNITPDKKTGIGGWSDADFIKAMHDGINPQGEYYYPAFPYIYFNHVSIDDLKAMKAYLDSIPPVARKNRENDMLWPFNWRFIQLGWRLLFFQPTGPFKENPQQSALWNRGAYLVEGLGHCAMCHTPSYYILTPEMSLAAPIRKYNLTGANVEGYLAPNITKTNLGAISDKELMQVFTENHLIGGGIVQGPMVEAIHDSLMHLHPQDLMAIIKYLKSVESTLPPQPIIGASGIGESVYNAYCSGCHATGVGGAPRTGDAANWGPLVRSGIDKLYRIAITGGGNMPAKGTCIHCSDLDIKQAVDYIITQTMKAAPPPTAQPAAPMVYDGKRIYDANCSSCHSSGRANVPQLGDRQAWKSIEAEGFLNAYQNVVAGRKGHPRRGGCSTCTDQELLAAVKYILQEGSTNKNYLLW